MAQTPVVESYINKRVQRSPDPKYAPKLDDQYYERLHTEVASKSKGRAMKVAQTPVEESYINTRVQKLSPVLTQAEP